MKPRRGKPDHEAESISVRADSIEKPEKIYRNAKHNGNRTSAKGNVEIKVNRQKPENNADEIFRPRPGTILKGGEEESVIIESKRIQKQGRHNGKDVANASRDVRIFGKLRRAKK
jgi:hypothetical protein